ncbi:hypothetical protein [Burkholderia cenocepacia]|uniref:hypothetical protein n=1 Tax=Burkholderia cenocepacia TaxID=95486 RepID=UPI002AB6739E|nr:hypothetical protein [Burkholderia cenocepacia]
MDGLYTVCRQTANAERQRGEAGMRVSDVLRRIGRPISYYPGLAHILGSVNAAVLFCQLFYWQDKTTHELGVHKTSDELRKETGLSYEEQRTARRLLKKSGVLVETEKRIEHKIYFKIDEDALERIIEAPAEQSPPDPKSAEAGNPNSRNGESPFRETGNPEFGESGNSSPPTGQPPDGGAGDAQSVYTGIDYCIDYKQQQRAGARDGAVDNTTAGALLLPDGEKDDEQNRTIGGHDAPADAPSADERAALELLRTLEAARGAGIGITAARDLAHVRAWLASGASLADLSDAYRRAVAARNRDTDGRPVNAGFLGRFVDEVCAQAAVPAPNDSGEWWDSASGIERQGDRVGIQQREKEPSCAARRHAGEHGASR